MNRSRYSISRSFVGEERVDLQLVQVDRALERAHERLRVVGEVGAAPHEVAQDESGAANIGRTFVHEYVQPAQTDGDVPERDRAWSAAAAAELLVEHRQRTVPLHRRRV